MFYKGVIIVIIIYVIQFVPLFFKDPTRNSSFFVSYRK